MLFHIEMACLNLMWRGKTWFQCVRGRHACGKHTLGCLQLISPWSYSLQWMDFASLSMGVGSMRFTNSMCGALHYGHARRWLKGLGWDLRSSFWEKFWSDLTVCIGFAVSRLFLMVAVSFSAWTSAEVNLVLFNAKLVQWAVKDQVLQGHLVNLPWYIRWCLKFIISALMWRDECVWKTFMGLGLRQERDLLFLSVLLLERSLPWWDPALAETRAPSFFRFIWRNVFGTRRSDKTSWYVAFGLHAAWSCQYQ